VSDVNTGLLSMVLRVACIDEQATYGACLQADQSERVGYCG